MVALPEKVQTAVTYLKNCVGEDGTILLFGSRARCTHLPGRDFDIALVPPSKTSWQQFCVWKSEAKDLAWPYVLDLVDLRRAPDDFLDAIRNDIILLHGNIHEERLHTEET